MVLDKKLIRSVQAFAMLDFKLQWCIIAEVEEDLTLYPPQSTPVEPHWKKYRYTCDVLGINNMRAVRSIEKRVQEVKDKQELMPTESDYASAKLFLRDKGLPVSLLEIYDYLDQSR